MIASDAKPVPRLTRRTVVRAGVRLAYAAPLVVACLQHEMWNTYEIEFKAQVCNDAGAKVANARFVKVTGQFSF